MIIHDDLVREALPGTPTLYKYKIQTEHKSFYNTPPTYSWYIAGLTLAWMKKQGGVKHFAAVNRRKAEKLYHFIDAHREAYINSVHPECRSMMNVPFNLVNINLTDTFLSEAHKAGLTNLKGHRLSGGVRASIYNPMPEEGVDALVAFMADFAKRHG